MDEATAEALGKRLAERYLRGDADERRKIMAVVLKLAKIDGR